jgi:hypothetical protein
MILHCSLATLKAKNLITVLSHTTRCWFVEGGTSTYLN